ncbi:MAG: glycine betaine/proline transport system substrate-binding protein [Saprospiraceae bacterium]|jgi:glycine betaine/proline transport system substrate-binding protein
MKMKSKLIKQGALAAALAFSANGAIAACGDIQIAEWNWASGELMANVDKVILEAGWDCNVEMIPGATTTTFASMNEKGQPHIAGELWINAVREPLNAAFDAGSLHSANGGPITGLGEGWWIPRSTAEANPELKTVLDILERPDLFPDAEDESKGAFIGCPAGWGCQLANANLYRAFDMEAKGWKLVDPGSQAGLDGSMTKAVERGKNWFGYYWAPTAMLGKNDMVLMPFGVPFAGAENWDGCIVKPEQECADPQPSAWTESEVHTVVTDDFKNSAGPEVMEYLGKRVFSAESMGTMLVYMLDNQAAGIDAAAEFLLTDDIWEAWVSPEIAAKVKASLN